MSKFNKRNTTPAAPTIQYDGVVVTMLDAQQALYPGATDFKLDKDNWWVKEGDRYTRAFNAAHVLTIGMFIYGAEPEVTDATPAATEAPSDGSVPALDALLEKYPLTEEEKAQVAAEAAALTADPATEAATEAATEEVATPTLAT